MRPVLISIGVHAAVIGAIAWTATGRERQPGPVSFYADAPHGSSVGLAGMRAPLPLGRTVSHAEAAGYVGQYLVTIPGRANLDVFVTHINDGDMHWSLMVQEGELYPYKLIPIANDSFASQMNRERQIVFQRRDSVVGIELRWGKDIRRGAKVSTR